MCLASDTHQRLKFCRVPGFRHTAKFETLTCPALGTRQRSCRRRQPCPVSVRAVSTFFRHVPRKTHGFAVYAIKSTRQSRVCRRCCSPWECRRRPRTAKLFAVSFCVFAMCRRHTANRPIPVVAHAWHIDYFVESVSNIQITTVIQYLGIILFF